MTLMSLLFWATELEQENNTIIIQTRSLNIKENLANVHEWKS